MARGVKAAAPGAWPADAWTGTLLVVRLSSLGDVVLTTGPLRCLKQRRPQVRVELLTRPAYAPLLAAAPAIDRVRTTAEPAPLVPGSGEEARYARVLDWQGSGRGRRAAQRFAPGVARLGARRAALRRRLLVWLGPRIVPPASYVERLAESFAGRRLERRDLAPELVAPAAGRAAWSAAWPAELAGEPVQVLAPGASKPLKAIPRELRAALRSRLARRGPVVEIVSPRAGGSGTPAAGRSPAAGAELQLTRVGSAHWRVEGGLLAIAGLLERAAGFIGSDSGLLHMAYALGCPAVGLYGATAPELGFAPLGTAVSVGVRLPCRPCHVHGPRVCWLGHRRCWREIDPDRVMEELTGLQQRTDGA